MQNAKISDPRAKLQVQPSIRRMGDAVSPGAMVVTSRARVFVHYAQLRQVADALHDICDEFEAAEREDRLDVKEEE